MRAHIVAQVVVRDSRRGQWSARARGCDARSVSLCSIDSNRPSLRVTLTSKHTHSTHITRVALVFLFPTGRAPLSLLFTYTRCVLVPWLCVLERRREPGCRPLLALKRLLRRAPHRGERRQVCSRTCAARMRVCTRGCRDSAVAMLTRHMSYRALPAQGVRGLCVDHGKQGGVQK